MENNEKLIRELKRARNELCHQCGSYKNAHAGSCNGCHWKIEWLETIEAAEGKRGKENI